MIVISKQKFSDFVVIFDNFDITSLNYVLSGRNIFAEHSRQISLTHDTLCTSIEGTVQKSGYVRWKGPTLLRSCEEGEKGNADV